EEEKSSRVGDSRVGRMLMGLLVVALLCTGLLYWKSQQQQEQIKTLTVKAKALKIRAPGTSQTLRFVPSETRPVTPQYSVSLAEARMLDVHLDVSMLRFNSFALTIDKTDEARIVIIRRMVAD